MREWSIERNRWNSKVEGEGDAIGTFEFPARAMARPFFLAWIQQNKFHLFILYLEFRFGGEYDFLPMDVVEEDLRVSFPENSKEFSN